MLCIECNTHAAISLREAPLNSALAPQISCAPLWRWPLFQKCTDALPRVSVSQIARHCLARDSIRLRFVNLCSWREGGSVRGGGLAGRSVCVCGGGGGGGGGAGCSVSSTCARWAWKTPFPMRRTSGGALAISSAHTLASASAASAGAETQSTGEISWKQKKQE